MHGLLYFDLIKQGSARYLSFHLDSYVNKVEFFQTIVSELSSKFLIPYAHRLHLLFFTEELNIANSWLNFNVDSSMIHKHGFMNTFCWISNTLKVTITFNYSLENTCLT